VKLKFRDYIFVVFISVFPFLLLLISLRFTFYDKFVLNNTLFWILIIILSFIALISLIISLFYVLDHIIYYQKKFKFIHLILLFIFNLIYVPFYYGNYMVNEKLLAYFTPLFNIFVIFFFGFTINNSFLDYSQKLDDKNILFTNKFTYLSKDELFTINIDRDYTCKRDMGDYVIACDNNNDDSFLGIYSYKYSKYSLGQLDQVFKFHLNQTKNYISEAGFDFSEVIVNDITILSYDDMDILLTYIDYDINFDGFNDYRLILFKEVLSNEKELDEFNNFISSIRFVS